MRAIEATITGRWQVTIPVDVRKKLGLSTRQKVTFLIQDDCVELVPTPFTFESVFGSVEPLPNQSLDFEREIEEALSDHADEVVRRLTRR